MKCFKQALILLGLIVILLSDLHESPAETQTEKISRRKTLTIGLVPEINLFRQVERYEPLADYLSEKIGFTARLKIFSSYGDVIEAFVHGGLDGAFLGSFTCVLAHIKSDVEIVARPVNIFGRLTYHGLIFVRKDSGIKTITEMGGRRFAFVDKATTAGYLFPIAYFKKYGIEDPHTYFNETYFSGTYQDVVNDVLNGKADVGAAKNTVLARLAAADGRVKNELAFLERSAEIPENCFAARNALEGSIRHKLTDILLNMHMTPQGSKLLKGFGVQRFVAASINDYSDIYTFLQEVGFNLEKYEYMDQR